MRPPLQPLRILRSKPCCKGTQTFSVTYLGFHLCVLLTIPSPSYLAHSPFHVLWLSPLELDEVKRQVTDLLAKGMIHPSTSPYSAPILFVVPGAQPVSRPMA
ncbi:hypothetical protein Vafri_11517 [Volvox africanus]|nr:hypothetical protein Vafri_11517 [Volvox africanus]